MNTKQHRAKLERLKGAKEVIRQNLITSKQGLKTAKKSLKAHEQANEILKQVGLQTQQQLQYHINDIATLALESIFGENAYKLEIEFVERRDKTECDIYFIRDGEKLDPVGESGGGAVDIASFALRIASWSMENPVSRNVIILDEPMRFLSADYQEKASLLFKKLSEKLNIQFIIITQNPLLDTHADKIFTNTIRKKITRITEKETQ